jgi:hypothetical protein
VEYLGMDHLPGETSLAILRHHRNFLPEWKPVEIFVLRKVSD